MHQIAAATTCHVMPSYQDHLIPGCDPRRVVADTVCWRSLGYARLRNNRPADAVNPRPADYDRVGPPEIALHLIVIGAPRDQHGLRRYPVLGLDQPTPILIGIPCDRKGSPPAGLARAADLRLRDWARGYHVAAGPWLQGRAGSHRHQ